MNVLSLPDEMLASVLKYTSFENLTKLRKVSSKIDSVARRYGLDKVKIDRLDIRYRECELIVWVQSKIYRKYITRLPSTDLIYVLKYIFSKIRGVKNFYIHKTENVQNTTFSNEVGEFLLGNDCKNITNLSIDRWDISISFNTMRRILTKLKLEKLVLYATFTEFEFSDVVIEGISFYCLHCDTTAAKPIKLRLPYLARLCALNIPSTLTCEIKYSTVADLITFFKLWTKDMTRKVDKWSIVIPKGFPNSVDETERHLSELKCFEDYQVTMQNNGISNITIYYINRKIRNTYWATKIMIKTIY